MNFCRIFIRDISSRRFIGFCHHILTNARQNVYSTCSVVTTSLILIGTDKIDVVWTMRIHRCTDYCRPKNEKWVCGGCFLNMSILSLLCQGSFMLNFVVIRDIHFIIIFLLNCIIYILIYILFHLSNTYVLYLSGIVRSNAGDWWKEKRLREGIKMCLGVNFMFESWIFGRLSLQNGSPK